MPSCSPRYVPFRSNSSVSHLSLTHLPGPIPHPPQRQTNHPPPRPRPPATKMHIPVRPLRPPPNRRDALQEPRNRLHARRHPVVLHRLPPLNHQARFDGRHLRGLLLARRPVCAPRKLRGGIPSRAHGRGREEIPRFSRGRELGRGGGLGGVFVWAALCRHSGLDNLRRLYGC